VAYRVPAGYAGLSPFMVEGKAGIAEAGCWTAVSSAGWADEGVMTVCVLLEHPATSSKRTVFNVLHPFRLHRLRTSESLSPVFAPIVSRDFIIVMSSCVGNTSFSEMLIHLPYFRDNTDFCAKPDIFIQGLNGH
jgi:hypothetical protein